ncbi:MAG: DUF1552 domain-containing protein [Myxococcales bacterium]|nr:MAG: DUF1552 domain-containing protein [Myxococcales bacterium]
MRKGPHKKLKLNRRAVLRGMGIAGIAIALPPLEAMLNSKGQFHRVARSENVDQPKRFVLFHWGDGAAMDYWKTGSLSNLANDSILNGLRVGGMDGLVSAPPMVAPVASDVTPLINAITNIGNDVASTTQSLERHTACGFSFSTGLPAKTESGTFRGKFEAEVKGAQGISVDQAIAKHIRGDAPYGSINSCARNIGGASDITIVRRAYSFGEGGQFQDYFVDPRKFFDDIFTQFSGNTGEPDPELEKLKAKRGSVLDYVDTDIQTLQNELGQSDREKLEEHLTSIRELELRLSTGPRSCESPATPAASTPSNNEAIEYQNRVEDLLTLHQMAFICDLTRVMYVSLCSSSDSYLYSFLGHTSNEHGLSHSSPVNSPAEYAQFAELARWRVSRFAHFIEKLNVPLGDDTTLLDHCAVVGTSEMGDVNHRDDVLPVLVAGNLGGMTGGGTVAAPSGTQISNLWLTAMRAVGVSASDEASIGNSTGTIGGLWI